MPHLTLRPLSLRPLATATTRPGDFGIRLTGDGLLAPRNILIELEKLGIRDGVQLVSFANAFPSSLASVFGWSVDEVIGAREALLNDLRGLLPDEVLNPPPAPLRAFGAMPPVAADESEPS